MMRASALVAAILLVAVEKSTFCVASTARSLSSFRVLNNGVNITLKWVGNEYGLATVDANGFAVEWNPSDSTKDALYSISRTPQRAGAWYILPNAAAMADSDEDDRITLEQWDMLSSGLQISMIAHYSALSRTVEAMTALGSITSASGRLARSRTWHTHSTQDGFPRWRTILSVFNSQLQVRVGDNANAAFLIGNATVCTGTLEERALASDERCRDAVLVKYSKFIRRTIYAGKPHFMFDQHSDEHCCETSGHYYEEDIPDFDDVMGEQQMHEVSDRCKSICAHNCDCESFDLVRVAGNVRCRFYETIPDDMTALPAESEEDVDASSGTCRGCFVRASDGIHCDTAAPGRRFQRHARALEGAKVATTQRTRRAPANTAATKMHHHRRNRRDVEYVATTHADGPATSDEADYRVRRQLVIPMRFSDHGDRNLPTRHNLDMIFNSRGGDPNTSTPYSIRDYYLENSYHKQDILSIVVDWQNITEDEAYYSGGCAGLCSTAQERLCEGMLDALQSAVSQYSTMEWTRFLFEGQSDIKDVIFIHSGYGAEYASGNAVYEIWSQVGKFSAAMCSANTYADHTIDIPGGTPSEINVTGFLLMGACYGDSSKGDECPNYLRPGLAVHQMAKTSINGKELNNFDEIPGNSNTNTLPIRCTKPTGEGSGIGGWGLLGDFWGFCSDQLWVPGLSAYAKKSFGWVKPMEITNYSAKQYVLEPRSICPDVVQMKYGMPDGEYLLVENARSMGLDAPKTLSTSPNILVSHIDDTKTLGNYRPDWTANNNDPQIHYQHKIEQIDGNDDLECGNNYGDPMDVATVGKELKSTDANNYAHASTYSYSTSPPSATSYYSTGANIKLTSTTSNQATMAFTTTEPCTSCPTPQPSYDDWPPIENEYEYKATCAKGHYGDRDDHCVACPIGKYNPYPNSICASSCQICPDGTYTNDTGNEFCTICPMNTYQRLDYYPRSYESCYACVYIADTIDPGDDILTTYCDTNDFGGYGGIYAPPGDNNGIVCSSSSTVNGDPPQSDDNTDGGAKNWSLAVGIALAVGLALVALLIVTRQRSVAKPGKKVMMEPATPTRHMADTTRYTDDMEPITSRTQGRDTLQTNPSFYPAPSASPFADIGGLQSPTGGRRRTQYTYEDEEDGATVPFEESPPRQARQFVRNADGDVSAGTTSMMPEGTPATPSRRADDPMSPTRRRITSPRHDSTRSSDVRDRR
eukprot:m.1248743 g.1248743  ORF g.1248743 m.1248743 type:complete len:1211 (+) comp24699_c0_seq1:310-3942(+)